MPLHLLKLAVGVADLDDLRRVRAARLKERGGNWVFTRNRPRREDEVLAGGSIYWVIRGQIRVRQRVTGFDSRRDENGRRFCRIILDPELIATQYRAWRPFQGWRYLTPEDAPPDRGFGPPEAPPPEMLAELRALGLL